MGFSFVFTAFPVLKEMELDTAAERFGHNPKDAGMKEDSGAEKNNKASPSSQQCPVTELA